MTKEAREPRTRGHKKKERTRRHLIAAGLRVLGEKGHGLTVSDVVAEAEVSNGTFYNYFPDKQAVLRELVDDFHRELRRRVHEARASATRFEEMLRSAFGACFRFFVEDEVILSLMMRNAGEIYEIKIGRAHV